MSNESKQIIPKVMGLIKVEGEEEVTILFVREDGSVVPFSEPFVEAYTEAFVIAQVESITGWAALHITDLSEVYGVTLETNPIIPVGTRH